MGKYITKLKARIAINKKQFRVYSVLRLLVIITGIRSLLTKNYESLALCILSLVLFLLPSFFEERLKVYIPAPFQIIIYLFIYAAEILGEVNKYYTAIPGWDTMLHTINGFLCGAIGLSFVFILNRRNKDELHLSPFFLAIAAFCFSMTIGVLWEFIEFSVDHFLYLDMQKDYLISNIGSIFFDTTKSQIPIQISNINKTIIETTTGNIYTIDGGYIDIGLYDTMKDLLVNALGALVFSIFGYFYEKSQNDNLPLNGLLIKPLSDNEQKEWDKKIEDKITSKKNRKHKQ